MGYRDKEGLRDLSEQYRELWYLALDAIELLPKEKRAKFQAKLEDLGLDT